MTDITDATHLTQGAVSQTIGLMVADGLLVKRAMEDARKSGIHLSSRGRTLLKKLQPHWDVTFEAIATMEQEIGPHWPPERKLVDSGYADLPFPFEEQAAPALEIRKTWTLAELLGYISTWSAVRRVREASREDILQRFARDLAWLWGEPSRRREVRWPINMRLGKR